MCSASHSPPPHPLTPSAPHSPRLTLLPPPYLFSPSLPKAPHSPHPLIPSPSPRLHTLFSPSLPKAPHSPHPLAPSPSPRLHTLFSPSFPKAPHSFPPHPRLHTPLPPPPPHPPPLHPPPPSLLHRPQGAGGCACVRLHRSLQGHWCARAPQRSRGAESSGQ